MSTTQRAHEYLNGQGPEALYQDGDSFRVWSGLVRELLAVIENQAAAVDKGIVDVADLIAQRETLSGVLSRVEDLAELWRKSEGVEDTRVRVANRVYAGALLWRLGDSYGKA